METFTIKELIEAYRNIKKEKIEKAIKTENEKIKKECNGHYTSYNRCYYLKYRPEDEHLLIEVTKCFIDSYKNQMDNYKLKKLLNLLTRLEKHHIYWKLENKL